MKISVGSQVDGFDALVTVLNGYISGAGVIEFWSGSIPASCGDAETGTLIVSNALSATPLGLPSGLHCDFDVIADGTAVAAGTVTYARVKDGAGGNCIMQFTCGLSGTEILFDNATFAVSDTCQVTSLAFDGTFT